MNLIAVFGQKRIFGDGLIVTDQLTGSESACKLFINGTARWLIPTRLC